MDDKELLSRITVDPKIFSGKPIIRGRRLAVEHVLEMLAAGSGEEEILAGYDWLEREDIRLPDLRIAPVARERVEPVIAEGD